MVMALRKNPPRSDEDTLMASRERLFRNSDSVSLPIQDKDTKRRKNRESRIGNRGNAQPLLGGRGTPRFNYELARFRFRFRFRVLGRDFPDAGRAVVVEEGPVAAGERVAADGPAPGGPPQGELEVHGPALVLDVPGGVGRQAHAVAHPDDLLQDAGSEAGIVAREGGVREAQQLALQGLVEGLLAGK